MFLDLEVLRLASELKSYLPIVLVHHHPFSFEAEPEGWLESVMNRIGFSLEPTLVLKNPEKLYEGYISNATPINASVNDINVNDIVANDNEDEDDWDNDNDDSDWDDNDDWDDDDEDDDWDDEDEWDDSDDWDDDSELEDEEENKYQQPIKIPQKRDSRGRFM